VLDGHELDDDGWLVLTKSVSGGDPA
jgi:hypothetical protein